MPPTIPISAPPDPPDPLSLDAEILLLKGLLRDTAAAQPLNARHLSILSAIICRLLRESRRVPDAPQIDADDINRACEESRLQAIQTLRQAISQNPPDASRH